MTPLSIKFPDKLASASQEAELERREMAQSLTAMANSPMYVRNAKIIDNALDEPLADEQDNWRKS